MLKDLNDYELLELATENEEAKELLYKLEYGKNQCSKNV